MTPKASPSRDTKSAKAPGKGGAAPRPARGSAAASKAATTKAAKPGAAKPKIAKAELSARIAEETGLSRKQAGAVVGSAVDLMIDALRAGRTVGLLGLGTLSITQTAERQGVRPGTTDRITIPAGKKIRFKISTGLREELERSV